MSKRMQNEHEYWRRVKDAVDSEASVPNVRIEISGSVKTPEQVARDYKYHLDALRRRYNPFTKETEQLDLPGVDAQGRKQLGIEDCDFDVNAEWDIGQHTTEPYALPLPPPRDHLSDDLDKWIEEDHARLIDEEAKARYAGFSTVAEWRAHMRKASDE